MQYYVYVLQSLKTGRYYVGQTYSIDKRLREHNAGLVRSTKSGIPWQLIWMKVVESRKDAMEMEKKIKGRGIKRFLENRTD